MEVFIRLERTQTGLTGRPPLRDLYNVHFPGGQRVPTLVVLIASSGKVGQGFTKNKTKNSKNSIFGS